MAEQAEDLLKNYFKSDVSFNEVYPLRIRMLASRHWTPIHVVKQAVDFLSAKGGKILDIGSGAGKFCLAGAYYAPDVQFFGIEQRESLVRRATRAQRTLDIKNVSFIHGNFTQLNLLDYDHFYFFNSFFENINSDGRIDDDIEYSEALFEYYVMYLYKALQNMPSGTRIVTYHTFYGEVPLGYELLNTCENGDLNFWIKK